MEKEKEEIYKQKLKEKGVTCYEADTEFYKAAEYGYLETMKWLIEQGALDMENEASHYAAKGGHLHVLKWLKLKENHKLKYFMQLFVSVAKYGHFECMKWLYIQYQINNEDMKVYIYIIEYVVMNVEL